LGARSHRVSDSARLELNSGVVIEHALPGGVHGVLAAEVDWFIAHHAHQHDLGATTGAETGFILTTDPDTVRAPDVAFIAKDRLPQPIPARYFRSRPT